MSEDFFIRVFPFMEDFTLSAIICKSSGQQKLKISKIDKTGREIDSSSIDCIHTALGNITLDEMEEIIDSPSRQANYLLIKSSENIHEIHLSIEDKKLAFNSWVQGISEMGLEALYVQQEIEELAHLLYPIAKPLMIFILKHKIDIIFSFLNYIEKNCIYNHKPHLPSIRANLYLLANILKKDNTRFIDSEFSSLSEDDKKYIFRAILSSDIPLRIIMEVFSEYAPIELLVAHPDFPELFSTNDDIVLCKLAISPDAAKFDDFNLLFSKNRKHIKLLLARNPNAVRFSGFKKLVNSKNDSIRINVAQNSKINGTEYLKKLIFDKNFQVRDAIISRPRLKVPSFSQKVINIIRSQHKTMKSIRTSIRMPTGAANNKKSAYYFMASIEKNLLKIEENEMYLISMGLKPYYCTKCKHKHKKGKILKTHAEFADIIGNVSQLLLKIDVNVLKNSFESQIVGIYYTSMGNYISKLARYTKLDLIHEPENIYDRNAIKVMHNGRKLGYIPKFANRRVLNIMEHCINVKCFLLFYSNCFAKNEFSPERAGIEIIYLYKIGFLQTLALISVLAEHNYPVRNFLTGNIDEIMDVSHSMDYKLNQEEIELMENTTKILKGLKLERKE